jgi:hypothetical protein
MRSQRFMKSPRLARCVVSAIAALSFALAPAAIMFSDNGTSVRADCYNGVPVLNPYAQSCTVPGPVKKVRGSAPDANAIIACRHHPGCLSWYVNGP